MKNNNYEAVTLSVDSILFDLNTFKQEIYSEVMREHNLESHPYFFELLLDGGYQQIERAYIHYNQYRPIRKEMQERYELKLQEALDQKQIEPVLESIEFIDHLQNEGLKLGLVSSYPRDIVQQLLDLYPIKFEDIVLVCGNEVFEGKPEKDMYSKLAKLMKVDPHYTLAIEGTVNGVMAAYLASMVSVYVEIHKLRVEKAQKFSNYQCMTLDRVLSLI